MAANVVVKDLRLTFPGKSKGHVVLDGLSFEVRPGEYLAILGPSGSGKSCLLRILAGTLERYAPSARVQGEAHINVPSATTNQGRINLSLAPQHSALMPWRTVVNNVLLPCELAAQRNGQRNVQRAISLLRILGIDQFAYSRPYALSGGIAQRVSLARSLITNADLLLLDEPLNAVDVPERERIQTTLRSIVREREVTTIHVTHDLYEAAFVADKVIVLSDSPASVLELITLPDCERNDDFRSSGGYQQLVCRLRNAMRTPRIGVMNECASPRLS